MKINCIFFLITLKLYGVLCWNQTTPDVIVNVSTVEPQLANSTPIPRFLQIENVIPIRSRHVKKSIVAVKQSPEIYNIYGPYHFSITLKVVYISSPVQNEVICNGSVISSENTGIRIDINRHSSSAINKYFRIAIENFLSAKDYTIAIKLQQIPRYPELVSTVLLQLHCASLTFDFSNQPFEVLNIGVGSQEEVPVNLTVRGCGRFNVTAYMRYTGQNGYQKEVSIGSQLTQSLMEETLKFDVRPLLESNEFQLLIKSKPQKLIQFDVFARYKPVLGYTFPREIDDIVRYKLVDLPFKKYDQVLVLYRSNHMSTWKVMKKETDIILSTEDSSNIALADLQILCSCVNNQPCYHLTMSWDKLPSMESINVTAATMVKAANIRRPFSSSSGVSVGTVRCTGKLAYEYDDAEYKKVKRSVYFLPEITPRITYPKSIKGVQIVHPTVESNTSWTVFNIKCEAEGRPEPKLVPFHEGKKIKNQKKTCTTSDVKNRYDPKYLLVTCQLTLIVENYTKNNLGEYECRSLDSVAVRFMVKEKTKPSVRVVKRGGGNSATNILIMCALVALVVIGAVLIYKYAELRKRRLVFQRNLAYLTEQLDGDMAENEFDPERLDRMRFPREAWEIPRQSLQIEDKQLGKGAFGVVYQGKYKQQRSGGGFQEIPVAVKLALDPTNQDHIRSLSEELKTLAYIGKHRNIVCLVGVVIDRQSAVIQVAVEFCQYDSLKKFLNGRQLTAAKVSRNFSRIDNKVYFMENEVQLNLPVQKDNTVTRKELYEFSVDIANGMTFLVSKKIIHRDLAARNVLLSKDEKNSLIAKICDFGLAKNRSEYVTGEYMGTGGCKNMPWRWLAPECFRQQQYGEASDIWSYGVLLWEIFTMGRDPWAESPNYQYVLDSVEAGIRLSQPPHASKDVYQLMLECWSFAPERRPRFERISERFLGLIEFGDHRGLLAPGIEEIPTDSQSTSAWNTNVTNLTNVSSGGERDSEYLPMSPTPVSNDQSPSFPLNIFNPQVNHYPQETKISQNNVDNTYYMNQCVMHPGDQCQKV